MKIRNVIPCVCAGETDFTADGTAGMPVLRPYAGHDSCWHIWCPKCKIGVPSFDYKSPYKALQAWNEMQEQIRKSGWLEQFRKELTDS